MITIYKIGSVQVYDTNKKTKIIDTGPSKEIGQYSVNDLYNDDFLARIYVAEKSGYGDLVYAFFDNKAFKKYLSETDQEKKYRLFTQIKSMIYPLPLPKSTIVTEKFNLNTFPNKIFDTMIKMSTKELVFPIKELDFGQLLWQSLQDLYTNLMVDQDIVFLDQDIDIDNINLEYLQKHGKIIGKQYRHTLKTASDMAASFTNLLIDEILSKDYSCKIIANEPDCSSLRHCYWDKTENKCKDKVIPENKRAMIYNLCSMNHSEETIKDIINTLAKAVDQDVSNLDSLDRPRKCLLMSNLLESLSERLNKNLPITIDGNIIKIEDIKKSVEASYLAAIKIIEQDEVLGSDSIINNPLTRGLYLGTIFIGAALVVQNIASRGIIQQSVGSILEITDVNSGYFGPQIPNSTQLTNLERQIYNNATLTTGFEQFGISLPSSQVPLSTQTSLWENIETKTEESIAKFTNKPISQKQLSTRDKMDVLFSYIRISFNIDPNLAISWWREYVGTNDLEERNMIAYKMSYETGMKLYDVTELFNYISNTGSNIITSFEIPTTRVLDNYDGVNAVENIQGQSLDINILPGGFTSLETEKTEIPQIPPYKYGSENMPIYSFGINIKLPSTNFGFEYLSKIWGQGEKFLDNLLSNIQEQNINTGFIVASPNPETSFTENHIGQAINLLNQTCSVSGKCSSVVADFINDIFVIKADNFPERNLPFEFNQSVKSATITTEFEQPKANFTGIVEEQIQKQISNDTLTEKQLKFLKAITDSTENSLANFLYLSGKVAYQAVSATLKTIIYASGTVLSSKLLVGISMMGILYMTGKLSVKTLSGDFLSIYDWKRSMIEEYKIYRIRYMKSDTMMIYTGKTYTRGELLDSKIFLQFWTPSPDSSPLFIPESKMDIDRDIIVLNDPNISNEQKRISADNLVKKYSTIPGFGMITDSDNNFVTFVDKAILKLDDEKIYETVKQLDKNQTYTIYYESWLILFTLNKIWTIIKGEPLTIQNTETGNRRINYLNTWKFTSFLKIGNYKPLNFQDYTNLTPESIEKIKGKEIKTCGIHTEIGTEYIDKYLDARFSKFYDLITKHYKTGQIHEKWMNSVVRFHFNCPASPDFDQGSFRNSLYIWYIPDFDRLDVTTVELLDIFKPENDKEYANIFHYKLNPVDSYRLLNFYAQVLLGFNKPWEFRQFNDIVQIKYTNFPLLISSILREFEDYTENYEKEIQPIFSQGITKIKKENEQYIESFSIDAVRAISSGANILGNMTNILVKGGKNIFQILTDITTKSTKDESNTFKSNDEREAKIMAFASKFVKDNPEAYQSLTDEEYFEITGERREELQSGILPISTQPVTTTTQLPEQDDDFSDLPPLIPIVEPVPVIFTSGKKRKDVKKKERRGISRLEKQSIVTIETRLKELSELISAEKDPSKIAKYRDEIKIKENLKELKNKEISELQEQGKERIKIEKEIRQASREEIDAINKAKQLEDELRQDIERRNREEQRQKGDAEQRLKEEQARKLAEEEAIKEKETQRQLEESKRLKEDQERLVRETREKEAQARKLAEEQVKKELESKRREEETKRLKEDQERLVRETEEREKESKKLAEERAIKERELKRNIPDYIDSQGFINIDKLVEYCSQ